MENSDIKIETNNFLADELVPPEMPVKSGRGRKSKKDLQNENMLKERQKELDNIVNNALQTLVTFPFDFLSARRGKHWAINSNERKALTDSVKLLLEKYSPGIEKYSVELFAAITFASVLIPRINTDMQIIAEKTEQMQTEKTSTGVYPSFNN